ncbi:MAG: chromosomal replication initiator protein DnaA [Deltaproteobacteria bacterium]|nr:chromosomal replication initiator protein DnaA [Deltaproteobacteria bacterium]
MREKTEIWQQVTRCLEEKVSRSDFNTWFSHTTLKKCGPEIAVIGVPNKFVADWLREKYQIQIRSSFETVLNQAPQLLYSYDRLSDPMEKAGPTLTKKTDEPSKYHLDPSMTFKRFIVGDSNRFASLSALEVAKNPADQYNPLYIFSKPGLGKTHLLNAIGHHVLTNIPYMNVKYIHSNTFTSDFTYSIKANTFDDFKYAYSNIDVLLFDDVHLLTQRRKTQEEFLVLFNSLYRKKKQIVVTGDRPPNQIAQADPRLTSRLGWGLISEIAAPDQKIKMKIIEKKGREDSIGIPDDVIFYLSTLNNDIKSLIRNVTRIKTYASLNNRDINISMAKAFIKDYRMRRIEIDDVKSIAAGYFNIPLSELISNKKQKKYSYPRQMAMYLCRKYTDLSLKKIGEAFGKKDHSTVIYAIKRINQYKDIKREIKHDLKIIENLLS